MAKTLVKLRALSLYEEPNASFAVSNATSTTSFLPVPADADSITWTHGQKMLNPNELQQYLHGRSQHVVGPRVESTISFKLPLFLTGTLGTAATATLTRGDSAGLLLLDMAYGGSNLGTNGSAIATATAQTDLLIVTDASGLTPGGCVGRVTTAGAMEIREISTITSANVTLKHSFSELASVSDVIYSGQTFYPDNKSTQTTCQFLVEGEEPDDYWVLLGCMPSGVSFDLTMGEIPSISFDFHVTDWVNLGSGSLTGKTYSNWNALGYNAGELLYQTYQTATRAVLQHHTFEFDCSLAYQPWSTPDGVQLRGGYLQNHTPPFATCRIGTYFENPDHYTDRSTPTLQSIALQMGTTTSGGILMTMPRAQVQDISAPEDADSFTGSTVTCEAMLDGDATDQTTALRRAAHRLHIVG